jgi:hypothetical protein
MPSPIEGEQQLFDPGDFGAELFEDATRDAFPAFVMPEGQELPAPLRLRRIRLERVLGFQECTVDVQDFNILVGANNSGKSSLLRIIRFGYTLLHAHFHRADEESAYLVRGRNLDDSLLPVAEVRDLWFGGIRRSGNDHLLARIEMQFEEGLTIEFGLKSPFGHATSRLISDSTTIERSLWNRLVARPIVYVPSSVGVVAHEEYRTPVRVDSLVAGGHVHEVLRNLLLSLQESGRLSALDSLIGRFFNAGLGVVAFDAASDQFIRTTYRAEAEHDLFNVGAGFLQILQVLAFLVNQQPGVLLVDEPDAHLHSSLQRTAVDVLRAASADLGMQVLVATHSKEIINYVDPDNLLVVDRAASHLEGLGSHETAISVLESLGSIDSVDAFYVLRTRRLLLVEGKSDTKVLHGIATKRGMRLFEGDSRVVAIETGGDSTPAARSDLSIVEQIIGAGVDSLQIRDRDSRIDDHIAYEEAVSPRPVHFWRLGSIESYLVVPDALVRLVVTDTGLEAREAASAVADVIETAVASLADDSFDRVSTTVRDFLSRTESRGVEVAEANRRARQALQQEGALFRLAKGKLLLAKVRFELQDRLGVTFGTQRLIDEIDEAEVAEEVWEVLDRIAALTK